MNTLIRSTAFSFLLCSALPAALAEPAFVATPGASIEIPQSTGKFDFLRVDTKRHRLLAAHEKDSTVDIIDLSANKVLGRVKVGEAVDTATDADSKFYFVSVQEGQRVAVLDADTLKETKSVKTAGPTDAILYDPTNHLVYVTHDGGDHVWAIDPATAKVVATISIPGVPELMVYDQKANRIYLNIKDKDVVAVIDPSSNSVVAQWPTAPASLPHGLVIDADHHTITAAGGNGKLVAIDTSSGKVTGSADIVAKVDQIAFDAVGGLVYSAGPGKMSVTRATGGQLAPAGEITTAAGAKNAAVDPATREVWTTYSDGKSSFAKSWHPPKL